MKRTKSTLIFATATLLAFVGVAFYYRHGGELVPLSLQESESKENGAASRWVLDDCESNARERDFLLRSLGLSSLASSIEPGSDLNEIRVLLEREYGDLGGSLSVLSVKELTRSLNELGTSSGVVIALVSKKGLLYSLLGSYEARGKRYCQVSQGSALYLLEPDYFAKLDIQEAWLFQKEGDGGIPIQIGSNLLVVDKICHNFGETPPLSSLSCSFELKNPSAQIMIIEPPQTSCGCVAAQLSGSQALFPGDSYSLKVVLQSGTAISFRQKVSIRVRVDETRESKSFDFVLIGNHPESMSVSPKEINFGEVEPGESATKDVVFKEVLTDRFSVLDVKSDDEFVSWKVDSEDGVGGLKTYRLHLMLAVPEDFESSEKRVGALTVFTDSEFTPKISIPITYEVPPYFAAVPSVVSFGTVDAGVSVSAKVALTTRDGSKTSYKFVNLPDTITQKEERDGVLLTFAPAEGQKGVVVETLEVEVATDKRSERLLVKCVAFAR